MFIPCAEQSPTSYLLYFKRATAHLSLSRHEPALADFDKVLQLTGGTFDKALLSKGKIFAKEGRWTEARDMIKAYSRKNIGDRAAGDLVRIRQYSLPLAYVCASCLDYPRVKLQRRRRRRHNVQSNGEPA